MSEGEPKFPERLPQIFIENLHIGASDLDYADALGYAPPAGRLQSL
jgi:hypothetical protein